MYDDYLDQTPELEIDYTLENEESLEEVAQAFETSVEEITEINPDLTSEQYVPGQQIRLRYRPANCSGGTIYTVRGGETLGQIAARFRTTEEALRAANPFLQSIRLRAGLALCIPPRGGRGCPGGFFHTVAAGDSIYRLATRYGISVAAILQANPGLDLNRLYVGQRICIPSTRHRPIPTPRPSYGGCARGFLYTVAYRDNLYAIASRFGIPMEAIIRVNPGLDPRRLYVGQQICIPRTSRRREDEYID
jgi:peptidoglycan endopeptidase LytF